MIAVTFQEMIDAGKVVAPLVGAFGVGWTAWAWWQAHRTHVTVSAKNLLPVFDHGPGDWCFSVDVLNRGTSPVEVRSVGFEFADGSDRRLFLTPPPGATLPGVVPPRSSSSTWHEIDRLAAQGFDVHGRVVAFITTAAGETLRSEPVVLRTP